jgi:alkylation response protein AidB-like acyl-CoA dehydrogenase
MNVLSTSLILEEGEQASLLATIDRWLEREVKPVVKEHDHADRWPAKIVREMQELGLFGATIGTAHGGLGLPATTYAEIVMRISAVWMAITGIFNSHLMLALAIEKFGTEPQKRRWLPNWRAAKFAAGWRSPSPTPAPTSKASA